MKRIVFTTFGSLGDLHPYLAVALGLKRRGRGVVVAGAECYRRKIEALGISFSALRPDMDWLADPEMLRRMMHPRWGLIRVLRELLLPALKDSYADTLQAADGAGLLVCNRVTYATRLVAEVKGIPWVSAMHLPTGVFSAYDPPLLPGNSNFSKKLLLLGPTFWKPLGGLLKWATHPWSRPWHQLRAEIGLPPAKNENLLVDGHSPALHLALFSKQLADKQPDWSPQTLVTGFPLYDQHGDAGLPPALSRFLDDGPPPLVFTLGTAVAGAAGAFYEQSAMAAKLLGRRAVLILNDQRNRPSALPEAVAAFDYVPFSELFPRSAAIIHHGGIGTTSLAMRAGRPMLVVPFAWDQPDNAERVARLGIARILPRQRYTPERAAAELQQLLNNPAYLSRASDVGQKERQQDGVRTACDALEKLIGQRQ